MSGDGTDLSAYEEAISKNVETIVNALGEGKVSMGTGRLPQE